MAEKNSNKKRRIVYMGTPEYASIILKALLESDEFEVVLVLTQPDRPVGRKKVLTPPPVKELALEHNIRVLQPERLSLVGVAEEIEKSEPDFIVVAAFGQLLPKNILDIAPCINLHASILPAYRGASPVQQSLLAGDRYTGVTAMLMEEGLDSGPILAFYYTEIDENMRLFELMGKLSEMAAELTLDTLKRYETLLPLPQVSALASHCKKIRRIDGKVNLSDAEEIYRKYRAFEGWPGVFLENGMKLLSIELLEKRQSHEAGIILDISDESIDLACGRGSLRIHRLQPNSKKAMSAKAYCLGRGLKVGDSLL